MNSQEFRADLHCHSIHSDGTDEPEAIIDLAAEVGLSGLSITDHDGVGAYSQELFDYAKNQGIELISGVEFSTRENELSVHILGYNFDVNHASITDLCTRHKERRRARNREMLERLRGRGIVIAEDELNRLGVGSIGRPHIAQILVERGVVASIQEAFELYLGDNKACFVPGDSFDVGEAVNVIHAAGGSAFIAHPHLIRNHSKVKKLLRYPFDGIEAYYGRFRLDQERPWIQLAEQKELLISGGSDYHGSIKPEARLGSSWVGRAAFDRIRGVHERAV